MPNIWEDQENPISALLGIPGTLFRRAQAAASPNAQGIGGTLSALADPGPVLRQDKLDELRKQHPEVFTAIDYDLQNGDGQSAFRAVTQFETALRSKGDLAAADALVPVIYATQQKAIASAAPMEGVARMGLYQNPTLENINKTGKNLGEMGLLQAQAGKETAHAGQYNKLGELYGEKAQSTRELRPFEILSERAQANQRNAAAGASTAHAGYFNAQTTSEGMRQKGTYPLQGSAARGAGKAGPQDKRQVTPQALVQLDNAISRARSTLPDLFGDDKTAALNDIAALRARRDQWEADLKGAGVDPEEFRNGTVWMGPAGETGIGMSEVPDNYSADYLPNPGQPAPAGPQSSPYRDPRLVGPTLPPGAAAPAPIGTTVAPPAGAGPTVVPPVVQSNRGQQSMTASQRLQQLLQAGMTDAEAKEQLRREVLRAMPADKRAAIEAAQAAQSGHVPPTAAPSAAAPTPVVQQGALPIEGTIPGQPLPPPQGSYSSPYSPVEARLAPALAGSFQQTFGAPQALPGQPPLDPRARQAWARGHWFNSRTERQKRPPGR